MYSSCTTASATAVAHTGAPGLSAKLGQLLVPENITAFRDDGPQLNFCKGPNQL